MTAFMYCLKILLRLYLLSNLSQDSLGWVNAGDVFAVSLFKETLSYCYFEWYFES